MAAPKTQSSASTQQCLPECTSGLRALLHTWSGRSVISHFVDNPDAPGLGSRNDICIYPLKEKAQEVPGQMLHGSLSRWPAEGNFSPQSKSQLLAWGNNSEFSKGSLVHNDILRPWNPDSPGFLWSANMKSRSRFHSDGKPGPDQRGAVGWASSCKARGGWSGHMLGVSFPRFLPPFPSH